MNHSPIEPTDPAFAAAIAAFRAALHPCDRGAAVSLAVAQRDLAIALASSPEVLAGYEDTVDPVREYDEWVARMTESEEHARRSAIVALRRNREYRARHPEEEQRRGFAEAQAHHVAIKRAAAAIDAMLRGGPDAVAAREDVLHRWPERDVAAEIRFVITYSRAEA